MREGTKDEERLFAVVAMRVKTKSVYLRCGRVLKTKSVYLRWWL